MDVPQRLLETSYDKSLENYFHEIDKIPLLTIEEEIDLAKKIKEGNKQALRKLVLANLRFVVSVARKYRNSGLQFSDLVSEGNLGLIEAANRFDESKGFRFITYAVWWIRQSILQAITNHARLVRLPANQISNIKKMTQSLEYLEQKNGRQPTFKEIASSLDFTEKKINDISILNNHDFSMLSNSNCTESRPVIDTISDESYDSLDKKLVMDSFYFDVNNVLKLLTSRESDIVCLYFGVFINRSYNLEEIARRYKLSRERIRQIKEDALEKLRNMKKSNALRDYL